MSENIWSTKVKATCIEKRGKCHHEVGESHAFETPISYVEGMCLGIQDPAWIWVTHCAAGLPSWEGDNPEVYRIHCISKKGTVWEFQRVEEQED
jgi:uncharacterized repeat protein (TIGR04076 family)